MHGTVHKKRKGRLGERRDGVYEQWHTAVQLYTQCEKYTCSGNRLYVHLA